MKVFSQLIVRRMCVFSLIASQTAKRPPHPHLHTQVAPPALLSTTKTKDDVQEVPAAASQVRPEDVIRAFMCVWGGGW